MRERRGQTKFLSCNHRIITFDVPWHCERKRDFATSTVSLGLLIPYPSLILVVSEQSH